MTNTSLLNQMTKKVFFFFLAIDFAEHDVEGADDGDDVSQHQVLSDVIDQSKMGKAGSLNLTPEKENVSNLVILLLNV